MFFHYQELYFFIEETFEKEYNLEPHQPLSVVFQQGNLALSSIIKGKLEWYNYQHFCKTKSCIVH